MYNLIYTRKFGEELKGIEEYISNDNLSNALFTVQSILSSISLLKSFPGAGREYSGKLRILVESNYKYRIIYRVEKKNVYLLGVSKYKSL